MERALRYTNVTELLGLCLFVFVLFCSEVPEQVIITKKKKKKTNCVCGGGSDHPTSFWIILKQI